MEQQRKSVYVEEYGDLPIVPKLPSSPCRYVGTASESDTDDGKCYDVYEANMVWFAVHIK